MLKKIPIFYLFLLVLLVFGAKTVFAFPLFNSGLPNVPGTTFEDNDRDYFEDMDGDGKIGKGDVIWAAIEFDAVNQIFSPFSSYTLDQAKDELVALSVIELDYIDANGNWIFKEYNNQAMIQVYSGGPINLNVLSADPTLAAAKAAILDGTHLWDFSITSDPDTYWSFQPLVAGADDPSQVRLVSAGTKIGVANFQLNQVFGADIFAPIFGSFINAPTTLVPGDRLIDMSGSADILGGLGLTNAFARSDADADVNPIIPEPTTISLLGIGLLAIAGLRRKSI